LVGSPDDGLGEGKDLVDEREEVRLVVLSTLGESSASPEVLTT
jgi:hypothetical protein